MYLIYIHYFYKYEKCLVYIVFILKINRLLQKFFLNNLPVIVLTIYIKKVSIIFATRGISKCYKRFKILYLEMMRLCREKYIL